MHGGGIMQLLQYGAQDIYLMGNINQAHNEVSNYELNEMVTIFDNLVFHVEDNNNWFQYSRELKTSEINKICPISLKRIQKNDTYCLCINCDTMFSAEELKKQLCINNKCPCCLHEWTVNIEYVY